MRRLHGLDGVCRMCCVMCMAVADVLCDAEEAEGRVWIKR